MDSAETVEKYEADLRAMLEAHGADYMADDAEQLAEIDALTREFMTSMRTAIVAELDETTTSLEASGMSPLQALKVSIFSNFADMVTQLAVTQAFKNLERPRRP